MTEPERKDIETHHRQIFESCALIHEKLNEIKTLTREVDSKREGKPFSELPDTLCQESRDIFRGHMRKLEAAMRGLNQ